MELFQMSRNDSEDYNSSSISESTPPVAVPPSGTVGSAAIRSDSEACPEEHGDERAADSDAIPPPLGVKLTAYRLLNVTTMFAFSITKGILSYEGLSTMPTTLDWLSGGVLGVVLYWIGLYEARDSKKWEWFFQVDLAPKIGYRTKRAVAEVMWPLFFFDGLLFISSLGNFLGNVAVLLLARFRPRATPGAPWGIYIGVFVGAHVLWYSVGALVRCVLARFPSRKWAIVRFVNSYGPTLPEEKYGFRKVSRISSGVVAIVGLSVVFYHYLVWLPLCERHAGVVTLCDEVCEEGDCVTFCGDHAITAVLIDCERTLLKKLIRTLIIDDKDKMDNSILRYPEVVALFRSFHW